MVCFYYPIPLPFLGYWDEKSGQKKIRIFPKSLEDKGLG